MPWCEGTGRVQVDHGGFFTTEDCTGCTDCCQHPSDRISNYADGHPGAMCMTCGACLP